MLSVAIIASLLIHVYFISRAVVNVVQRESIEIESNILSSYVGDLEEEYLALSKDVTRSFAYSLGFEEPSSLSYATRKTFAIGLSATR